jgi:hypothetical protein
MTGHVAFRKSGTGAAIAQRNDLKKEKAQCNLQASRFKTAGSRMTRLRPIQIGLLIIACVLSGCALLPQPDVLPPDGTLVPNPATAPADATGYRIDAAELEIHTFRAGWLSGLAHNHVIETDVVIGRIDLADPIERSRAALYFRPWDLVLDDPATRAAAGSGFESERSAADIAATRTRMLGPRGFDSNQHPWVAIDVRWQDADHAALTIGFRGREIPVVVPLTWSREGGTLRAAADFELSHRALGIRPYSAFAGAIAVADPIRIQIRLSARETQPL